MRTKTYQKKRNSTLFNENLLLDQHENGEKCLWKQNENINQDENFLSSCFFDRNGCFEQDNKKRCSVEFTDTDKKKSRMQQKLKIIKKISQGGKIHRPVIIMK